MMVTRYYTVLNLTGSTVRIQIVDSETHKVISESTEPRNTSVDAMISAKVKSLMESGVLSPYAASNMVGDFNM
jgi:hypothetical protein